MKFINLSLKLTQLFLGVVTVGISCLGIDNLKIQAADASSMNLQVSQNNLNFPDNLVARVSMLSKESSQEKQTKKPSSSKPKFTDGFRGLKLNQPIPEFKFCKLISADVESLFDGKKDYDYTDAFIDGKGYRVTNTEPCYFNMALNGWSGSSTGNASNFSNLIKEEEVWHICNLPDIGGQKCFAVVVRNNMLIGLYDSIREEQLSNLRANLISKYGQPSGSNSGDCINKYGTITGSWQSIWWWANGSSLHYENGCTFALHYLLIKSKTIHDLDKKQQQEIRDRQRNNL